MAKAFSQLHLKCYFCKKLMLMGRKLSYSKDEESNDIVKRYEQFLSGASTGYFDVEELETIVEFYLRKGRTKDCSKALDLGLQLHPNNNALKSKRAKIYLATGDNQKALRILESLTETSDYEVVLLKIEVLVRMERLNEARVLSDKLIKEESEDIDNVCLDVAFIYLGQGEYETAQELLEKGDNSNKKNVDLLFELAFCYEQNDLYTKAIETYNRIIDIDSFMDEAWFNLGQIYFAMQDFPKALEAYDFALAIDEKDSLTCLQKAHVHFQLDQFNEAIIAYKEYKDMTSDNWQTDLFIAECYEKMEQYDNSIIYYKQSLEAEPTNFEALTGIAICLLEQEKFIESIDYVQQALAINENASDAWVYLAEGYIGLEQNDNALLAYLKSISLDPEQPDTLMAIANICLEKAEFTTAIQYYLTAKDFDKTLEYIDLFISVAYYKSGDKEKSEIFFKQAIAENENAASLFYELCPEASNPIK